jgi:ribonuclease P/MRP protein subunit POP8
MADNAIGESVPQREDSAGKRKRPNNGGSTLITNTIRSSKWTYFHLALFSPGNEPELDAITARANMNAAMKRFLGLTGSAMPIDILKLDGVEVWVRVLREHANAFHEAMSSWTSASSKYVVKGREDWLIKLVHGSGSELFL